MCQLTATFRQIGARDFVPSIEQVFLLRYRAICIEFHNKIATLKQVEQMLSRFGEDPRFGATCLRDHAHGVMLGREDLRHHQQILDHLPLDRIPFETDFLGRRMHYLCRSPTPLPSRMRSIQAMGRKGAATLSWIGKMRHARTPRESLMHPPDQEVGDAPVRLAFEPCEYVYFDPLRWNGLLPTAGRELPLRSLGGLPNGPERAVRMSSRGQVVIPEAVRNQMGLKVGSHFVVVAEGDMLMLTVIEPPAMERYRELKRRLRAQVRAAGLTAADVPSAVARVRGRP